MDKPHISMIKGLWHCRLDNSGFSMGATNPANAYSIWAISAGVPVKIPKSFFHDEKPQKQPDE